jgi:hypothetical protein
VPYLLRKRYYYRLTSRDYVLVERGRSRAKESLARFWLRNRRRHIYGQNTRCIHARPEIFLPGKIYIAVFAFTDESGVKNAILRDVAPRGSC